jgi:hypothetical protein
MLTNVTIGLGLLMVAVFAIRGDMLAAALIFAATATFIVYTRNAKETQ